MATDTADSRSDHIRGVTVTALTAILGIIAAYGALVAAGDMGPVAIANSSAALYALVAAILVQFPLLKASGIVEELSGKDVLYIVFMTFSLWFVSLTILLTTGVGV